MAAAREAADAKAVTAHHQPMAVVLDFVDPEPAGRWPGHLRRLAWFDEAGGTPRDRGRRITVRAIVVMLPPRDPAPLMTILSASSGNGRCSALASSHGACIQTSHSSSVVRITGIAIGWIGYTTAFGDVVRKP